MRLRASFTLENSVIIPIFTLIIAALIAMSIYFHDINIIKNALFQATVQAEKLTEESGISILEQRVEAYLQEKTIAVKEINVELEVTDSNMTAVCNGKFVFAVMLKEAGDINRSVETARCYPPDYIRKLRAVKKAVS